MQREETLGSSVGGVVVIFLSLAGTTTAMTELFLGMRSVMEIGGACASGGPYVPVRPCPSGVPALMVGGIWVGMILVGVYVWQATKHGIPNFAWALWPALFLSLGWNFLEYGLDPPLGEGLAWGWLVCGVAFFAMGGGPLLAALPTLWRAMTGSEPPPRPIAALRPPGASVVASILTRAGQRRVEVEPTWTEPASSDGSPSSAPVEKPDDLVSALERLSYLHRTGAIDDAEYEAAKARLLGEGA